MASIVRTVSSSVLVSDENHSEGPSAPTITEPTTVDLSAPTVAPLPHHDQQPLCLSRPRYRQGRRLTAVKAYTISDESVYLIINGVPGLKIQRELKNLCQKYGAVVSLKRLEDYPVEPFAEAHLAKYSSVREARFAKKMLDGKNFFGGVFHVCYAPELESVDETRLKLEERRRAVHFSIRKQDREQKRSETGSEGRGSVLCHYHPDDRLASAIKRVTNRLSYNKDLKNNDSNESHSNLKNGTNGDLHQFDASFYNKNIDGCDAGTSADYCLGLVSTASNDSRKSFVEAPFLQNTFVYNTPPPSNYCASTTVTNSQSNQLTHVYGTSSHQTNNSQSVYPLPNTRGLPTYGERLNSDPDVSHPTQPPMGSSSIPAAVGGVNHPTQPPMGSSSIPAGVGQTYASMSADYEPGIGRTSDERYCTSNLQHKRSAFSNKTTVKSFSIKPTKAYKRRKLEETAAEKNKTIKEASRPRLGYREVVRSLQQQRVGEDNGQLVRLQQALQATLGTPTAPETVRPAPQRPTAKIKLLAEGVKLV